MLTEEGGGCRWGYFLLNRPPGGEAYGETEAAAGMGAMCGGRPHLYPLQSHECPWGQVELRRLLAYLGGQSVAVPR